jgi:hypothetical protein
MLDRERERLTIIGRDPVGVPDVLVWLERQAADGAWAYGTLDDFRLVTWIPTTEDLQSVLGQVITLSKAHGRRGPVAFVTTRPALFGIARKYSVLSDEDVEAFYDLADAERWLDERRRVT